MWTDAVYAPSPQGRDSCDNSEKGASDVAKLEKEVKGAVKKAAGGKTGGKKKGGGSGVGKAKSTAKKLLK
jgi:hypothetical protein